MKNKLLFVLSIMMVLSSINMVSAAPEDVGVEVRTILVNGINRTVNVVTANLNSPDIALEVLTANDKVSGSEDFTAMINRRNPIAAINANFFDAYNSFEPYGSIMKNKKFTYLEGENTSLVISEKNKVAMDYFKATIDGYLDGKKENQWNNITQSMDFNIFSIWYVNNLPTDNTGVYLYTPTRGTSIWLSTGTAIEVIDNKITKITKNPQETKIPANGYIIYYGAYAAEDNYINTRFRVGRTLGFSHNFIPSNINKNESVQAMAPASTLLGKNTRLFGSINKKTKNNWNNTKQDMDFNIFDVWYINSKPIDSSGVYLYTPERGTTFTVPEGKSITVSNKVVSKVELKATTINIPRDGFVIYYGKDAANDDYVSKRFVIGQTIDFYNEENLLLDTDNIIKKAVDDNRAALIEAMATITSTTGIDLNKVDHMISAGPYLVKDSKVITNLISQGFTEDKITVNRAQRSAIGITKDNKLKLVTGCDLNMEELAQVMLAIGCDKAMNLDGGASSALYAKGSMITTPGRKLNTVLMIKNN